MLLANRSKRKDLDLAAKKPNQLPPARFNLTTLLRRFNKKEDSVPQLPPDSAAEPLCTQAHLAVPTLTFVDSATSSASASGAPSGAATYSSFSTECVSLPNSEMTSHYELDAIEEDMLPVTDVPDQPVASKLRSHLRPGVATARAFAGMTCMGGTDGVHPDCGPAGVSPISSASPTSPLSDDASFEIDDMQDITAYLSEAESDLAYNPNSEECASEYVDGGYHPVNKGEVYYSAEIPGRQYIALRKLGWGHFSTVWLAKARTYPSDPDHRDENDFYVALKFVKSNRNYTEAAEDEIRILTTLQNPAAHAGHLTLHQRLYFDRFADDQGLPSTHPGYGRIMALLDHFTVRGPHGSHICMVFEVLGENMLSIVGKFKQQAKLAREIEREKQKQADQHSKEKSSKDQTKEQPDHIKEPKESARTNPDPKLERKINTRALLSLGLLRKPETEAVPPVPDMTWLSHGGLPVPIVRQIMRQLLTALDYIHHCGVVHTDLKPENILMEIDEIEPLIRDIERQKVARFWGRHGGENKGKRPKSKTHRKHKNKDKKVPVKDSTASDVSLSGSGNVSTVSFGSHGSVTSTGSGPLSYTPSRNSVPGRFGSPVRSSKPLTQLSDVRSTSKAATAAPFHVKLADLGNATFCHAHFTDLIQTRQYRSPEIILHHSTWGASTDIWSVGCILFELITGDYLFDPHNGDKFDKDDDHLAQMIELLGEMPSEEYLMRCSSASKFFKMGDLDQVRLRRIAPLKYWGLEDVLVEKYKLDRTDPNVPLVADLILKCLRFNLEERFDARSLLSHPWLNDDLDWASVDVARLRLARPTHTSDVPGFLLE